MLEAVINGVSSRKVEQLLTELGVLSMSKSQVSVLCKELDDKAAAFRERALTAAYPYLMLDALYEKVRVDGKVISQAVVVAYAVNDNGDREVIGVDVVQTESRESWTQFLRCWSRVGRMASSWLFRVHLFRNVLAHVNQIRKAEIAAALRGCFEQPDAAAGKARAHSIVSRFRKSCTKAMEIFEAGTDDALSFMAFPVEHHRKLWSTNPIFRGYVRQRLVLG